MSLVETIELKQKYDALCETTMARTGQFFERLKDMYTTQLRLVNGAHKGIIKLRDNEYGKPFIFNLMDCEYRITMLNETAIIGVPNSLADKHIMSERVRAIVTDGELSNYVAGCIALSAKIDTRHFTIMRLFVNQHGCIAHEYGAGWKVHLRFEEEEKIQSMEDVFLSQPISSFILEKKEEWVPLKDVVIIDDIKQLNPSSNQIGFTQAP